MNFKIHWEDSGREPQCQPDPAFPKGIDLVTARDDQLSCETELPYPARRCGVYIVECLSCGLSVGVTTAGRPDDPRSIRLPCKKPGNGGATFMKRTTRERA